MWYGNGSHMTNSHLRNAKLFTTLMDSNFQILGIRFGWENIIGLVPGIGDGVALALSLYLLFVGYQMKLPPTKLAHIIFNIMLDFVIGTIPIIGDLLDVAYKSNVRNLRILEAFDDSMIDGEVVEN